jgi:hypothetical protein
MLIDDWLKKRTSRYPLVFFFRIDEKKVIDIEYETKMSYIW